MTRKVRKIPNIDKADLKSPLDLDQVESMIWINSLSRTKLVAFGDLSVGRCARKWRITKVADLPA